MRLLLLPIELSLQIFASWTLAYHLALFVRLPARLSIIPFIVIFSILLAFSWRRWQRIYLTIKHGTWFLLVTILIALMIGIFNLVNPKPDAADDFSFFHRAVYQLDHLDLPFIMTHTSHNVSGLPAISMLHIMTSYEPLVAMLAELIGMDPLVAYHNVSAFISGILLVFIYALLYRQFRLNTTQTILATLAACAFLFFDGSPIRSFGNIGLTRLWQGKTILFSVLMPMTLLLSYRFLSRPSPNKFVLVVLTSISAVGLSGSGVFLSPILIFGVSIAYLVGYGFSSNHLYRVIILNCASFYCVAVALGLLTGLIPQPANTSAWTDESWPSVWWQNLALVTGNNAIIFRDLLILLLIPLLSLKKPLSRFPIVLTLVFIIIFANPLLGPVWVKAVTPAAYWRLAYLFPLPWCAGLIPISFMRFRFNYKVTWVRAGLAIGVLLATLGAYQVSVLYRDSPQLPILFKSPLEYRFYPDQLAFSRSISDRLDGKNLLSIPYIAVAVALMNPTIKLETTRPMETLHVFQNADLEAEGLRRVAAQQLLYTCEFTVENVSAFERSLQTGVDAIVTRNFCAGRIKRLLTNLAPGRWSEAERSYGYVLFLRQ